MVDLGGGPDGLMDHGFSNIIFVIPGIVFISLSVFFGCKLYKTLSDRERRRTEKKKQRQQKKLK